MTEGVVSKDDLFWWKGRPLFLSGRQQIILEKLFEFPGRVVPKRELEIAIWGRVGCPDATWSKTVNELRHRFLEVDPRFDAILRTVKGIAWISSWRPGVVRAPHDPPTAFTSLTAAGTIKEYGPPDSVRRATQVNPDGIERS